MRIARRSAREPLAFEFTRRVSDTRADTGRRSSWLSRLRARVEASHPFLRSHFVSLQVRRRLRDADE
jgi:hypothetical protein